MSGTSSSIKTKLWWNSHWMVLFQNGVRQLRSPAKMAVTVQLRCYWKQLWSRWAITGSWEPLVYIHVFKFPCRHAAVISYFDLCSLFKLTWPKAMWKLPSLGIRLKLPHLNLLFWNHKIKLNQIWLGWSPFKIVSDSCVLHSSGCFC